MPHQETDEDGANNDVEGPADEEANDDNARPTARLHKRTGKVLTRKRQRDPSTWKSNVRKSLRQSGKQYTDSRGKLQPSRSVKTKKDCSKCKFKCRSSVDHPQIKITYLKDIPLVFSMRSMLTNARKLRDHQVNFTFIGRYSTLSLILNFLLPRRIDVMHVKQ